MSSDQSKLQAVDDVSTNSIPNETKGETAKILPLQTKVPNAMTSKHLNMDNIFGFIENLASSKLPSSTGQQRTDKPAVRRTSDLLDTLQKALLTKPPSPRNPSTIALKSVTGSISPSDFDPNTHFPVYVDIRSASGVPKVSVCGKTLSTQQTDEERDASTYVTFEAHGTSKSKVNSPEGLVYTTQVVEHSSNPVFNTRFNVAIPVGFVQSVSTFYKQYILI